MKKSTFVKLHRKITKWRWYKNPNTFRVFVHLLITANYTDYDFENITVHRGQLVTSYSHLAEALGFNNSIQPIRTALNHLKSTGEITVEKTSKGLIITVKNYDDYQKVTHNSTFNQHSANRELTFNQQQYKKEKNIKKVKKEREYTRSPKTQNNFSPCRYDNLDNTSMSES